MPIKVCFLLKDGSGTKDMIERATNQIKEILKQKKTHVKTE